MTYKEVLIGGLAAYLIIGIYDAVGYVRTAKDMQRRRMIPRGRQMIAGIAIGVILYTLFWPCPQLVSKTIYRLADGVKELRKKMS